MSSSKDIKSIETGIGPLTDSVLNSIVMKIKTGILQEPFSELINGKIKPYIYICSGLYIIIVVLLIVIMYLVVKKIV